MPSVAAVLSLMATAMALEAPVTVFGGFLGAGKTSAVCSILENRQALRIAVLVNDLARVNVDASVIRRRTDDDGVSTIELKNGCVCCGAGAEDLAPTIRELQVFYRFDHIVVELSGVADPDAVMANLRSAGVSATRTVAVVDADAFPTNFESVESILERPEILEEVFESQSVMPVTSAVVELLLRQIESADVLLVNKCDLASEAALAETLATCRALNAAARIHTTSFGSLDLDAVLPPLGAAGDGQTLSGGRPTRERGSSSVASPASSTNAMGVGSFVYRARRPFSGARLASLIEAWPLAHKDVAEAFEEMARGMLDACDAADDADEEASHAFEGLLRSKGIAWLDDHHAQRVTWSHAGRHLRIEAEPEDWWWAVLSEEQMRAACAPDGRMDNSAFSADGFVSMYDRERASFEGIDGDRRQEIVFIGTQLRDIEARIRRSLDACLLSDEEMQGYRERWAGYEFSGEVGCAVDSIKAGSR